jgi:hypothetical protein
LSAKQKTRINKILNRYDKSNSYGSRIFEEYKPAGNTYSAVLIILILLGFISFWDGAFEALEGAIYRILSPVCLPIPSSGQRI